ncbi:MAG: orotate phosphoribosyltransferase [Oscillospiraceae bacterium]|nr:orotate phosphoribosyltransferase [Oscillospiraceae bacterium]
MTKQNLAREIYRVAHLTGTFTLRSGTVSNEYFDKYLFEGYPALLFAIAERMRDLIPANTEILAGLEMGGIPVATALSLQSGLPCAFVRKKAKAYGTCKLAEGAQIEGRKIAVIEDVVTTGGQIIESVRELRGRGAVADTVLCVIQRDEKASAILQGAGLTLLPLFTMEYLRAQI